MPTIDCTSRSALRRSKRLLSASNPAPVSQRVDPEPKVIRTKDEGDAEINALLWIIAAVIVFPFFFYNVLHIWEAGWFLSTLWGLLLLVLGGVVTEFIAFKARKHLNGGKRF